jgi:hypothetical protein
MILALINNFENSKSLLVSAEKLASQLSKELVVMSFASDNMVISEAELKNSSDFNDFSMTVKFLGTTTLTKLAEVCEQNEISFLFIQLSDYRKKSIQKYLNACRELRIPYVMFKDNFHNLSLKQVIVPVNFLEEEVEKAQFAAAFGRFCDSEILILQANDYGSKALRNTERMSELFDKFNLNYSVVKAKKDSFGVDKEAAEKAEFTSAGLIIVTASREYGLDDIIFGPNELHLIKKSDVPVLLVNPRGDLYALCD